jgi:hypothetical protein
MSPCALDAAAADRAKPVGVAESAPPVADLVNDALRKARAADAVHFRLTASFEAEAPETYLRQLGDPLTGERGGEELVKLARHPLCLFVEGDRSAAGFSARVAIESEQTVKRYELRQADGRFYLRTRGVWVDFRRPLARLFEIEAFSVFVPGTACIQELSEGCDRIDFGPALVSGRIGTLIDGDVGTRDGAWQITGRLDPQAYSAFNEAAAPATYEPFARSGRIILIAGKTDRLPREFDFRYDLDRADIEKHSRSSAHAFTRRRGHVNIRLSQWGQDVGFAAPKAVRITNEVASEVFGAVLRAASLHY